MRTKVRGLHIIFHHILKDLLAQMLTILSSNNLQQGVLAGLVWIPVRLNSPWHWCDSTKVV